MGAESPSPETKTERLDAEPYELLGGMDACRALAVAFYARVPGDPILGPMHSPSLRCARDALTHYIAQFLGGPAEYAQERWSLSLREAHLRFAIGPNERAAWLKTMNLALEDRQIAEPLRSALYSYFERMSAHLLNQPQGTGSSTTHAAEPPAERQDDVPDDSIHHEVARRWAEQRALEAAVAAVRVGGDSGLALQLIESSPVQSLLVRDRAAWLSLLALLSSGDDDDLLTYVRRKLADAPDLIRERYTYGRTLLHGVAGAGSLAIVNELLRLGADPNAMDKFGKTPLYLVGNECLRESGADIVRALAHAGADVDVPERVKHCTPLHMAARRGNMGVAQTLLECGANLEVRDSRGETPLRRAVNCGKTEMAALLLSCGADALSKGYRGLTPRQAARSAAMKQVFAGL